MFEISQRVENELDSGKNQDKVIPSINLGFNNSSNISMTENNYPK